MNNDLPIVVGNYSGNVPVKESSENKMPKKFEKGQNYATYLNTKEPLKFNCIPCGDDGKHVEARGFCSDCEKYLCAGCFTNHTKGRATRHHTLLDKEYIRWMTVKTCNSCKTTGAEINVEGYCSGCNKYLCKYCHKSHLSKYHAEDNSSTDDRKLAEKYNYVRDINVNAETDKKHCYVVAMTSLSRHKLVLADQNNVSIKCIDLDEYVVKHVLSLESKPYGATTVSENQVAVALSEICVIRILKVDEQISIERNISVSGSCHDVECLNGKLFASFIQPVKFQIIHLKGIVDTTMYANGNAREMCLSPRYIAVNGEKRLIYVSDKETKNVLCLDRSGNLKYIQQSVKLDANDITISPSGAICVCSRRHHAVYHMTQDLRDVTVMLGAKNGLIYPQALCYNVERQQVYISSGSENPGFCNIIKVFKFEYK